MNTADRHTIHHSAKAAALSAPRRSLLLLEARAAVDFARMLGPLAA
ncbi:MAG: hypothetical protein AB8B57_09185 [Congregibacter sp.]